MQKLSTRNDLEPCSKEGTTDPISHLPSRVDDAKPLNCLHILRAQADVTEGALVWLSTRADML